MKMKMFRASLYDFKTTYWKRSNKTWKLQTSATLSKPSSCVEQQHQVWDALNTIPPLFNGSNVFRKRFVGTPLLVDFEERDPVLPSNNAREMHFLSNCKEWETWLEHYAPQLWLRWLSLIQCAFRNSAESISRARGSNSLQTMVGKCIHKFI